MGLDMCLGARRYIGRNFSTEGRTELEPVAAKLGLPADAESYELEAQVAYWRKANAIHKWFVDNCAEGKDDCRPVYVEREKLAALRDICQRIVDSCKLVDGTVTNGYTLGEGGIRKPILEAGKTIANPELAAELLPTENGFFFGSTDYDQWYLENVQDTLEQIDKALALPDRIDFYYRASW